MRVSLEGRPVLRDIRWRIAPRERWLLTGHNGAGKTMLLKLIAGDVWPTAEQGRRHYLYRGSCFEQPQQIKSEIAYLGPERQDRYERYGWNFRMEDVIGTGLYRTDVVLDAWTTRDRDRIARLMRRLGLQGLAGRRFLTLSYGERRLVLLARALAWAPKLLLLDELFNGLDPGNRRHAVQCLRTLSRSALPWVLSSHREEDVPGLITHVCELERGVVRTQGPRARRAALHPQRPSSGARAASGRIAPRRSRARPDVPLPPPLVRLQNASVWREGAAVLQDVSFEVRPGECWLMHGHNGSGKSSCLQLIYGDLGAAVGGQIERSGIRPGVPLAYFKRRVGFVAPELQAMHPREVRVDEVVASGLHASIGLDSGWTRSPSRVRQALRRVGAAALERRLLRTLSYGQLRRVLFARALVGTPDLLLLDEPYAGVDAGTRERLQRLVERLADDGTSVVIAAHHAGDCPANATHELQLSGGRVQYAGPLRGRRGRWPGGAGA